jgi:carbon-monoxide dehydrogenase medium subunit
MRSFTFIKPESVKEAVSALQEHGAKARILAGGTDLVPEMKLSRQTSPEYVVSLKAVSELNYLREEGKGVAIGAMTPLYEVVVSPTLQQRFPALVDAAKSLGSPQVRNLGTVGGNICRASPSADLVPPLVVYGTRAIICGPQGERSVLVEEFFVGPQKTVLGAGEVLTGIFVPEAPSGSGAAYLKHGARKAMEIAIVGAAAMLQLDGNARCQDARICLGAVGPTVMRAKEAEKALRGQTLEDGPVGKAAEAAARAARPISDVRSGEAYRREMVGVYTRRAIEMAKERAAQ